MRILLGTTKNVFAQRSRFLFLKDLVSAIRKRRIEQGHLLVFQIIPTRIEATASFFDHRQGQVDAQTQNANGRQREDDSAKSGKKTVCRFSDRVGRFLFLFYDTFVSRMHCLSHEIKETNRLKHLPKTASDL